MKVGNNWKRVVFVAPILGILLFGVQTVINVAFGYSIQRALGNSAFITVGVVIVWIPMFLILNFFNNKKKEKASK
ncbi:hypothetical protein KDA_31260 [Dictyobacter alpinus]|uniref:Uncharacterized protein n=1 Tax=Dictyobacter alpinus TaxID=2014873 RepID=A0A402B8K8_9CHLR|nr:hypothetical protein [Dictyobacter alpinus]GCE27642.1 hypothetical protein KDA_31260 [Dictyobacter alpinus]